MAIRTQAHTEIRIPIDNMMGVLKTYDMGGKVMDATFWFGGKSGVKFGRVRRPYTLASMALVTPEGAYPIEMPSLHYWETIQPGYTVQLNPVQI